MPEAQARFLRFSLLVLLTGGLLTGCAQWVPPVPFPMDLPEPEQTESTQAVETPKPAAQTVATHGFNLSSEDSVAGRLAKVKVHEGDTLLDIARHFGVGYQHIVDANPGLDIWIPQAGEQALLPLQFILPDAPRKGIVINLAAMRLFYFAEGKTPALYTWPIGIGREGRNTPTGAMSIVRKTKNPTWYVPASIRRTHAEQGDPLPSVVPPGPDNPLGQFAFYLSKPSYLVHGTNKPFSIGLRASNGCIRLYPEDIERAYKEIPVNTPVVVVNQPYLLGWLGGSLYLEAHRPFEEIDTRQAQEGLREKLQQIAKKQTRKLDWPKIEETLRQARGIPVPVFEKTETLKQRIASAPSLGRPDLLSGQPAKAEMPKGGWQVRTAEVEDSLKPRRLAAQLNHLGPRIPALAVSRNRRYHVIAGPFPDEESARKVQRFLSEDFETHSEVVKPVEAPKLVVAPQQPAGAAKPGDGAKQAEGPKPVESAKPVKATLRKQQTRQEPHWPPEPLW